MSNSQEVKSIQDKYDSLSPYLNEKTRRIWAAIEARSLGWGGISQVALSNWTIPDYNPCWNTILVGRFGGESFP